MQVLEEARADLELREEVVTGSAAGAGLGGPFAPLLGPSLRFLVQIRLGRPFERTPARRASILLQLP